MADDDELKTPVLWPLVVIAGATAFIVTIPVLMAFSALAAIVAAVGAGAVGAPALSAARNAGLRGIFQTTGFGLLVAALATIAVRAMGGDRHLLNFYVVAAAIIGAATGAIYATLFDTDGLSGVRVRYQTMAILSGAVITLIAAVALGVR